MTFPERYNQESTWHGKVLVMEIYHLAMSQKTRSWTITATARHFNVSIALVSENLKLADAIHKNDKILKCSSRQEALKKLSGRQWN